jgi:hypothetical protein
MPGILEYVEAIPKPTPKNMTPTANEEPIEEVVLHCLDIPILLVVSMIADISVSPSPQACSPSRDVHHLSTAIAR